MAEADSMKRTVAIAATLTWSMALAACGVGEGGMGLPHQLAGETYPGDRMAVAGELVVAQNGCLELNVDGARYFVIWPAGATLDAFVRLPNGDVIGEGDRVEGTAALTPTAPLTANRDGYWANAIGFCAPEAAEVLVMDIARLPG
jgi:hypothetical protein